MINLVEIDGKLHKIIEKPVDQFNVKREAIPVTEEEFSEVEKLVESQHEKETQSLSSAKARGSLKKKADLDKVKDEVKAASEPKRETVFKKKSFHIG